MTEANDNECKQLDFPYKLVDPEDADKATELELFSSVRLHTAWFLNKRAEGNYEISPRAIEAIKQGNALAIAKGLPPIISDEELQTLQ